VYQVGIHHKDYKGARSAKHKKVVQVTYDVKPSFIEKPHLTGI
jgi:hypothetical protein